MHGVDGARALAVALERGTAGGESIDQRLADREHQRPEDRDLRRGDRGARDLGVAGDERDREHQAPEDRDPGVKAHEERQDEERLDRRRATPRIAHGAAERVEIVAAGGHRGGGEESEVGEKGLDVGGARIARPTSSIVASAIRKSASERRSAVNASRSRFMVAARRARLPGKQGSRAGGSNQRAPASQVLSSRRSARSRLGDAVQEAIDPRLRDARRMTAPARPLDHRLERRDDLNRRRAVAATARRSGIDAQRRASGCRAAAVQLQPPPAATPPPPSSGHVAAQVRRQPLARPADARAALAGLVVRARVALEAREAERVGAAARAGSSRSCRR